MWTGSKYNGVEGLNTSMGGGSFSAYPAMLGKGHPVREIMRINGYSPNDIVVAGDGVPDFVEWRISQLTGKD